jgi:hypothetical protein
LARRPEIRPSAFNILDAPTTSPIIAFLFSIKEYLYSKKLIVLALLLIISTVSFFIGTPKRKIKRVVTTKRQYTAPKKRKIIPKKPVVIKNVSKVTPKKKVKKVLKRKPVKRKISKKSKKRVTKTKKWVPYNTLLKAVINKSHKNINKCLLDYSSPRSHHRYKITVLPVAAKLDRIIPLSKSPRRLTYCLSKVFEKIKYPKRTSVKTISLIRTFSQIKK